MPSTRLPMDVFRGGRCQPVGLRQPAPLPRSFPHRRAVTKSEGPPAANRPAVSPSASQSATQPAASQPEETTLSVPVEGPGGTPLIPRRTLFGNPDKALARISPDGKQLSYLAPVDGVLNVWVGPVDDPAGGQAGHRRQEARHPRLLSGRTTASTSCTCKTPGGDEDWHVYSVDLDDGKTKDLTPLQESGRANRRRQRQVSRRDPGRPERSRSAVSRHLPRQHRHRRAKAGAEEHRVRRASSPTTTIKVRFATKMTARRRQPALRGRRQGGLEGVSQRSAWRTR